MCSDAAGLARSRTRTYEKRRKEKKRAFFDEGRDALRAVLWAVGPAPRARVSKRKIRGKENAWKATREDNLAT